MNKNEPSPQQQPQPKIHHNMANISQQLKTDSSKISGSNHYHAAQKARQEMNLKLSNLDESFKRLHSKMDAYQRRSKSCITKTSKTSPHSGKMLTESMYDAISQQKSFLKENRSFSYTLSYLEDKVQRLQERIIIDNKRLSRNSKGLDFLVYFYDNSNKLLLSELSEKGIKKGFRYETVKGGFKFPVNHRSIITANGQVLIIGGIIPNDSRTTASQKAYLFERDKVTVELHSQMKNGRASFGTCEFDGYVYAISGSQGPSENTSFVNCEKLDLQTRQWCEISACKLKASGCSVCVFSNKIYKFGGKSDVFSTINQIECYNSKSDFWMVLDINNVGQRVKMAYKGGCIQINEQQILIFGGLIHDVKTNECSVLDSQSLEIERIATLPHSGQVVINPLIRDNKIYVLSMSDNQIYLEMFNGIQWKTVTTN